MAYPLSQTQMGIYVSSINAQGEGKYNINLLYRLGNGVDIDRLACAINQVIAAHPTLFTRLTTSEEGDIVFEEHRDESFRIPVMTIGSLSDVADRIGADYDLMHDRLFRVEVFRTPAENYLYVDIHHIIADGMTVVHFIEEIGEVYDGGAPHAEPKNLFDLNLEEEAQRKSERYADAKQWYKETFAAAAGVDSLPQSDLHDGKPTSGIDVVERPLKIDADAIAACCTERAIRPSSYYTAAFAFLLSKYSGNADVLFSTIYHGRPNKEDRSAYSMMVKTLPVYQSMEATPTVSALMHSTSEQILASRRRTCYSFAEIHQDLGLDANIMFAYQGTLNNYTLVLGGITQQNMNIPRNIPGMSINVKLLETEDGPVAQFKYQTEKYSRQLIEDMAMSYETILKEFLVHEQLSEVSIVSPEQQRLLDTFHRVGVAEVPYKRFYEPLEHYAEATPDVTALVACDRTLTYRQLNVEANRVAHALIYKGVKPGDRVVLLLPRTSRVLCCMFGVSKAGAAYIPCDPAYPAERISLILEDAEAKYVITTADHLAEHGEKAILVDELFAEGGSTHNPQLTTVTPDDLAYLIYTSGSTGRPKGVMLRHEAICNYLCDHPANRHIHALVGAGVRAYLCLTTLSFDMSLKEFGVALHNGMTCVLANEEECENPMLLADLMRRHQVEALNATPSRLLGYMEILEFEEALSRCKIVMSGGEKYSSVLLDKLHSIQGLRIFNTYGPTEITVSSNAAELTHTSRITIGQPLLNYHEWVVDQQGNELPVGVVGELIIGGIGVAKGYNNLPEKTAEAFIEYGGMRAYRSGDYARWTRDGHIEVLGRKDGQIKLHGLRIEMGEIESCINKYRGIKQSVVKVCHINEDDFLVAYFTANEQIDTEMLKAEISTTLTHYMVPSAFMQLEAFPLTPNGKTDVKNLPLPELSEMRNAKSEKAEGVPSMMNDLEKQLYDLVAEALRLPTLEETEGAIPSFGVEEPLSLVGLSSLSAIKVATLIYKRFGLQLKSQSLMKGESLFSIENKILDAWLYPQTAAPAQQTSQTPAEGVREGAALTFAQTGVYYDIVRNPGSIAYNIPSVYTFQEGISAQQLVDAVKAVIAAHPLLGTHFEIQGTEVVQVYPTDFQPEVHLVSVCSEEEFEALKADFVAPFNPATGPLYRATVIIRNFPLVEPAGAVLLFDVLHLVSDGASMAIINRQLAEALRGNMPEAESYTFFEHASAEKKQVESTEFAVSEQFFTEKLKTVDGVSNITEDLTPQEGVDACLAYAEASLERRQIESLAKALGVTPAHLFLAAAYYTISRYTNTPDVCLCTISNGRSNLRVSDTVGMFVNTLAIVSHITDVSVRDFVLQTADGFVEALEHENYPFAKVADKFGFTPTVFFQYQVGVKGINELFVREGMHNGKPKFKFTISIEELYADQLTIQIQYDDTLYTAMLAQNFCLAMQSVLHHFMADVDAPLKRVSMLNDEQAQLIATFHETKRAEVPILLYHKLFEKSVAEHREELALVALNPYTGIYDSFTYGSLNEHMNCIAHSLIQRGVKAGDRVALLLPRTSRLIMSQYGVLKAGGAYIPCDPKYPTERINLILEDSEAKYILTTKDRVGEFPGRALDVEDLLFGDASRESNPDVAVQPDDLAYLIYTSGSTGRPKGVQLMHKGVCNYHHPENIIQSCLKNECHAALGITTISFDMSVWETGSPLMLGKTLILVGDDDCNDPNRLAWLIETYGIDCMTATTSRFMQLLESTAFEKAFSEHIHLAYQGGEGLSMALLRKLQTYPNVRIFNGYGPTETIANSHASELTHGDLAHIGKPCVNYTNYIVDADGNELPVGVVGELVIGGRSVAKGYNNLAEQTAAKFVEPSALNISSLRGDECGVVYRSGDYARWLPDGNVMVLGRKDNQVKLRGLRIELGEVETAITKVQGVKNVAVMIRKLAGKDHLCAYFTADRKIEIDDLKAEISQTLTHYMVPSAYLQMQAFPLTPNGKTDVKHLPEPVLAKVGGNYVAPRNRAEEDFCEIFGVILDLDKVSAADSFFELGGSSLTATRVVIEATNRGYSVSYAEVFKHPTAQQLAALAMGETIAEVVVDHEIADYDYSKIDALLAKNTLENFSCGERLVLGDVILTGANGYLGIHILHNLLENHLQQRPECKVYCLVRHGRNGVSSEARLRNLLFYYFEKAYKEMFGTQLFVIDGNVTSSKAFEEVERMLESHNLKTSQLQDLKTSQPQDLKTSQPQDLTLINCAAVVKHFSDGTEIEDINVGGLQNCVDFCLKTGARLIQTSTNSTAGKMAASQVTTDTKLDEQHSYIGQTPSSKYTRSKLIAERIMLEAIVEKGLVAKVMRLGNLSPRATDGEFQINFRSNSSMGRLHIFQMLGVYGYSSNEKNLEFSPIDEVAEAVILLSQTPKECVAFHPVNNHYILLGDVIREMAHSLDVIIEEVEDDVFQQKVQEAGQDPEKAKVLQSMLAYAGSKDGLVYLGADNRFTNRVLARLGFHWNVTSWDYVQKFIKAIAGMDFFEDKR